MFSQFFRKAKHTTITSGSGSFSHVEGDQFNHSTTIVQAEEKERSELDEYFYVKRGAIFRLRNIGINQYPRSWDDGDRRRFLICEEDRVRADRQICAAELVDRPGRVFTVVEYRGPDAKKAFEKDLATLMSELTANTSQMYGYNLSAIPSILLYNELVPAAQVNQDSECEAPRSTAFKTPAAGVHSAGFLSALLSPLSPTLSNDSDILTLGF
ncbi:hypothetical protein PM082_010030 [Marasmius tenuissimus]|nr:hypothetical protein PM082_010030 [Marasmius tenuissimus]